MIVKLLLMHSRISLTYKWLNAPGRDISNVKLFSKIFQALLKKWNKFYYYLEENDLTKLVLNQLSASLTTLEMINSTDKKKKKKDLSSQGLS